jgi:hypothetical protein
MSAYQLSTLSVVLAMLGLGIKYRTNSLALSLRQSAAVNTQEAMSQKRDHGNSIQQLGHRFAV